MKNSLVQHKHPFLKRTTLETVDPHHLETVGKKKHKFITIAPTQTDIS